jgi:hypothetical protein
MSNAKKQRREETESTPDQRAKDDRVYDTYIFVGEEQPFSVYRIEASLPEAIALGKRVDELSAKFHAKTDKKGDEWSATRHFIYLERYLTEGANHDDEASEDAAIFDEMAGLAGNAKNWCMMTSDECAPLCLSWKSARVYLLNTWC